MSKETYPSVALEMQSIQTSTTVAPVDETSVTLTNNDNSTPPISASPLAGAGNDELNGSPAASSGTATPLDDAGGNYTPPRGVVAVIGKTFGALLFFGGNAFLIFYLVPKIVMALMG